MTAPLSPLAAAQAELAADTAVLAIVGTDGSGAVRVRTVEPQPGDALGPGKYLPFVVVSVLDAPPIAHTGIRDVTLGLRCYGATYPQAEGLWIACESVFRDRLARVAPTGLGVYHSRIVSGGMLEHDPDTQQPVCHGIVAYPTTIHSVPT